VVALVLLTKTEKKKQTPEKQASAKCQQAVFNLWRQALEQFYHPPQVECGRRKKAMLESFAQATFSSSIQVVIRFLMGEIPFAPNLSQTQRLIIFRGAVVFLLRCVSRSIQTSEHHLPISAT
jgi:hypothetical protein